MAERKILPLWPGRAPYSDASPDQAQPSLTACEVPGADIAVVVCPGGGYEMKSDHEGVPVAEALNRSGIAGYVLDYRVKPCFHGAPLADALRAIRLVRSLGYRKVGILGFSAGGHLTCSAAVHWTPGDPNAGDPLERLSSRPDFFVPCYPVVSFSSYQHYGSCLALLGEADRHGLQRYYSNELQVREDTPPAFIWHTADDELVPVENSLMLAAALSRCNVPYELHIYPHGLHGMGLAEDKEDVRGWIGECAAFIHRICRD